ncbi:hypothetical protein [Actinosynnema sp. NPDC020468]|uniref:hypothetical protein n=1 Tax=Actinosynnema sp. NPDC020468 TaxID=3154488 RepID=UPI0033D73455
MTLRTMVTAGALSAAALATALTDTAHADITTPSLITCQTATLFGNYSPGSGHSDPITTLKAGTRVGFRYETGDSANVLWYQDSVWGFVQRSCVAVGAG